MRKLLPALISLLIMASCNRDGKQPAADTRFCGRWMTINPNHEYFSLKSDGSFADLRFLQSENYHGPKAISWYVKNDVLCLKYDYTRTTWAHIYKVPIQFTLHDTVKVITDSTLLLATPELKGYPSRYISLIKMKENGKFTTE